MKKSILAISVFAVMAATPMVYAEEGFSFNISAVSLYKDRGIDQDSRQTTDRETIRPAIQGGVDYSFGNGFYVGNWNSTGTFGNANLKMNLYGGFSGLLTENVEFDVGLIRYFYPSNKAFGNSGEVYVGFTMDEFSVKYFRGITSNVNKENNYLVLGYNRNITDKFNVGATLGFNDPQYGKSYQNYSLHANYSLSNNVIVGAKVAGTNERSIVGDTGKPSLIFSVGKSF